MKMHQKDGNVRRRHPGDAGGLPKCHRPQSAEFVLGLEGETFQRPEVEPLGYAQSLCRALPLDLGQLPPDVTLISSLNVQLLDDFRGRRGEALPIGR